MGNPLITWGFLGPEKLKELKMLGGELGCVLRGISPSLSQRSPAGGKHPREVGLEAAGVG